MASIQLKVDAFEWDENNERECKDHGLTYWRLIEIWDNRPLYFANKESAKGGPPRRGTHIMIGPDYGDRFWGVPILPTAIYGTWRPITGFPAGPNLMIMYENEMKRLQRW
jgi:hypothetical protein